MEGTFEGGGTEKRRTRDSEGDGLHSGGGKGGKGTLEGAGTGKGADTGLGTGELGGHV